MLIQKDTCIPTLTVALFIIAKIWKQPKCSSTHEWIKKICIHTQWNTIQPLKRRKFCSLQQHGWTWREDIMLNELRQILYGVNYMWNLKKYHKLVNIAKKKQIHRHRRNYWLPCRRGRGNI